MAVKELGTSGRIQQDQPSDVLHACGACLRVANKALFCPRYSDQVAAFPDIKSAVMALMTSSTLEYPVMLIFAQYQLTSCSYKTHTVESEKSVHLVTWTSRRWLQTASTEAFQSQAGQMRVYLRETIGVLFAGVIQLCSAKDMSGDSPGPQCGRRGKLCTHCTYHMRLSSEKSGVLNQQYRISRCY